MAEADGYSITIDNRTNGIKKTVKLSPTTSVKMICTKLAEAKVIKPDDHLTYNNKVLPPETTLKEFGVPSGATLDVTAPSRGAV